MSAVAITYRILNLITKKLNNMKTKVTDRRFAGCATKGMAPVILPSIGNLYDMYFNRENSNSSGLEIVEVDIENGTAPNDKIQQNAPTPTVTEPQSQPEDINSQHQPQPEDNGQPQRKRKGEKATQLQPKRVKHPPPVYVDEHRTPYWEVERVVGKRMVNNQPEYLVKWMGYSKDENTWEPMRNFHPLTMDCIWEFEYYLEEIDDTDQEDSAQNTEKDPLQENSA